MDELPAAVHSEHSRNKFNEEFLRRLFARRPQARERYQRMLAQPAMSPEVMPESTFEPTDVPRPRASLPQMVAETIVREERPVLFVKDNWLDVENVTAIGEEARDLITSLNGERRILEPFMPLIGRIDVTDFPNNDFVGTGWIVDSDIVVTNRHVASLIARWDGRKFAFSRGMGGRPIISTFNTLHEFDDLVDDQARMFQITEVLYIEPEAGPDIAFLRMARRTDGSRPDRISIAATAPGEDVPVVVVGYPARAPKRLIPDQELMKQLYLDRYDVKRAAPGLTMGNEGASMTHDCTTLGGNSGSVVFNMKTGEAVGLHYAGLYREANFAVPATVLNEYINGKRWNRPFQVKPPRENPTPLNPQPQPAPQPPGGAVTVTIPLSITVSLGQPLSGAALTLTTGGSGVVSPHPASPDIAEAAVAAFWDERPEGVVAARVGFSDDDDTIGDDMFISASVPADRLAEVVARAPSAYKGFAVRYSPANVIEQIDSRAIVESVDSINYDDDARRGPGFSFDTIEETMTVRAHVGPEYSWAELKAFLDGADGRIVSAMYEFHGTHIKDAIEARLKNGAALTMVLDNVSFTEVKHEDEEFDRAQVFKRWKTRFRDRFERVVVPEGRQGLISDAYHIKVTVRDDDTFWLSSGNWKMGSSQPIITDEELENASEVDLRGNREWHVVIRSATLAKRFRNHILQDFKRSRDLDGGDVPMSREAIDQMVDVAIEEAPVEERRPPDSILKPQIIQRNVKVKPLLTPDQEGAVYSEAVLELIRSARKSLLFQIPYISMPSNPRADRGYIDELLEALTQKLKTLDVACVLLRSGGSKFSAPTHAAWYFKSKGVDIAERLRSIENHHTKGMIVDGKRVLIGSHNWSKPGVTLNRDASLIFDDEEIAQYYTRAFEIDWDRANPIRPKRFVAGEAAIVEAVGDAPPPGYRRMRLSELLKEDD